MGSFNGLLNNAALMLILCVIYDTFAIYAISNKRLKYGLTGVLVGLIGIAVMLNPWSLQPGVFFDTRWVLLSLCGLFFGLFPTIIAVIITGSFRLYLNGPGGVVGTVVIVVTACVGLVWKYWKDKHDKPLGWKELYVFGFLVQLAMLSCMFLMPADMRIPIIKAVAPPILIIYPVLTTFIGLIMRRQEVRRDAELELEVSRKNLSKEQGLLKGVINSITDAIVFIGLDRQILMINKAFNSIFGYDLEEVAGKTAQILYANPDEYYQQEKARFGKSTTSDLPIYEIKYCRKDGSIFPSETISVSVKDSNDNIIGFLGVIRDVSDRRLAEKEKTKLESRLQQSQKMEAIGTLAGGIAHDFNNILSVILGYSEMARDDSPAGSSVANDLDRVIQAGHRAKDLVKQILAFSRQAEAEHIFIQPASLVKESIKMLRPSLPTTIEITQNIDPAAGPIFVDPTQIHQILMNLCTNAFHAMEETGGRLDISLSETTLGREDLAHEPGVKAGVFVKLSICDSGSGISPEIKGKIFDPFFTTKDVGKGTGMGLSIVHGIVKSYGGFISVYSEQGEGTAFHVFLPVIKKKSLAEVETTVEQILGGHERILFIDDEELLVEMGKEMLERLGYYVTIRNNSFAALETFQNQPDQFDVVITDQTMPGMTGTDLARRMLQIRPDIPIILCTGYSTIISGEKAKALGIKEFALKPLAKRDIAKLIRKVLDVS